MKLEFGATTLADHAATPPINLIIEQWGVKSVVDSVPLVGAGFRKNFPKGNVGGQFVCTTSCSYASRAAAIAAFVAAVALINAERDLKLYEPSTTLAATMAKAILRDVAKVEWDGVYLKLRLSFDITTVV